MASAESGWKNMGTGASRHDASIARRLRIGNSTERIFGLLEPRERLANCQPDIEAATCAAEVAVLMPLAVATHLVRRIETAKLDKAGCQAESHRRVVGPSTRRQAKRAASRHIRHGRETATLAKLDRRPNGIATSQAEKTSALSGSELHR